MFATKLFFLAFAVTLKACQSQEIFVGDRIMETRFLGTLNRYYISSWNLLAGGTDYISLDNTDEAVNALTALDNTQNVAIIVHGRQGSAFSNFAQTLRSSFRDNHRDSAIIVVDWAIVSSLDYATAFNSAPFVADDVISLLVRLDTAGKINRNLVHIVGFDVGAHIAGIVSRNPRARVQRITVKACQSQEIFVGDRIMETRFLGTLNRYYISSWNLLAGGTDYISLDNTDEAVNALTALDNTQNVAIIVHGRQGSAFSNFAQTLRSSFRDNHRDSAIIVVDWAIVSSLDYATAFNSAPFVADDVISLLVRLDTAGKINRNLVHIVGFDVGAHIAGIVSRNPRARVQRITGLSPAGQGWDEFSRRLRPTDAPYVEVLHTDYSGTRALGTGALLGTVDIFANTGTSQPGCSNNQCNHDRAWQLFSASLDMGGHLIGLRCDTLTDMTRNQCIGAPIVALGTNDLFKLGTGIYRANTGRAYPYNV